MSIPETADTTARTLQIWLAQHGVAALSAMASALPEAAVLVVDAERRVLFWSAGAERLLGFRADEVVGEHCLKSNRCERCIRSCGLSEQGVIDDAPLILYGADGQPRRVRKTGRAVLTADGRFAGGIEILVPQATATARSEADRGSQAPVAQAPSTPAQFHGLLSTSPAMQRVFQTIRNVAETEVSALIRGESGTGKELVARAIHAESTRAAGPFVAVNCAALTPTLLESELFGHVRGAFTGASRDRQGLFRQAQGGTLFLDEVAELPVEVQAKLLRVLQERVVTPVGTNDSVPVNVRVVAATHRSLRHEVGVGRFREDLMYRLRVVPIFLPPLRERRGDIELLLWRFIEERNALGRRHISRVAPDAMAALLGHAWPGNVRELQNVVAYAFAVGRSFELQRDELPPELREEGTLPASPPQPPTAPPPGQQPGGNGPGDAERIRAALRATGGHLGRAAVMLKMSRATLWRKRKRYGL